MKNIGFKIQKIRELKGWSREQMADQLGMSARGYGKIENGEVSISLSKIEKIANSLEIDPIKLLQFDESYVFNNYCSDNVNLVNKGTIQTPNLEELLRSKDELIAILKEQIKTIRQLVEKQ